MQMSCYCDYFSNNNTILYAKNIILKEFGYSGHICGSADVHYSRVWLYYQNEKKNSFLSLQTINLYELKKIKICFSLYVIERQCTKNYREKSNDLKIFNLDVKFMEKFFLHAQIFRMLAKCLLLFF